MNFIHDSDKTIYIVWTSWLDDHLIPDQNMWHQIGEQRCDLIGKHRKYVPYLGIAFQPVMGVRDGYNNNLLPVKAPLSEYMANNRGRVVRGGDN